MGGILLKVCLQAYAMCRFGVFQCSEGTIDGLSFLLSRMILLVMTQGFIDLQSLVGYSLNDDRH